jgi:hypothetical protein
MTGWPARTAFVLSVAFPFLAQAASGAEVVALFGTHCVQPIPSIEEIAATALRSGYEEHLLEVDDVFGSDGLHPNGEAYDASTVDLDARVFMAPAGDVSKPMMTAIAIKQTVAGVAQIIENSCGISVVKANEGAAGLDAWVAGIARVLKEKFGFPFKWERQIEHETDELSTGRIKWTPVGEPGFGEDRFGVWAILEFVEVEPRKGKDESSTWFLSVEHRSVRP